MGKKKKEKNEKDPNFLLKRRKTIFYPTHPVRKNEKNAMGLSMGVHKRGEKPVFHFWANYGIR